MDSGDRISISTVHEWRQIKENITAALKQSFESNLAGTRASKKDQEAARKALDEYLEGIFVAMKKNVRVNGQEMDSVNEDELDTEPFDEALDRKIWSLNATNLDWHKQLAHQSKSQPQEIQGMLSTVLEERQQFDAMSVSDDGEEEVIPDIEDATARFEQIEDVFGETQALNREIVQSLSTQKERVQRDIEVEADMKHLRS